MSLQGRRLLLVEDDPSLQRFVDLALADLALDIECCADVDTALAALAARPADLIFTDLMLPGRSGFELIEALAESPALRAAAELMVYSAGLSPAVRERLAGLGVQRVLAKPCTVLQLENAVREALLRSPQAAAPAAAPDARADAIARHFGGNRPLYESYRASCLREFKADLATGDAACAAGDWPALRRVAHNLKSVLLILGHAEPSALARQLEDGAAAAQGPAARALWTRLREQVRALG